jgi:hypothetical protein
LPNLENVPGAEQVIVGDIPKPEIPEIFRMKEDSSVELPKQEESNEVSLMPVSSELPEEVLDSQQEVDEAV